MPPSPFGPERWQRPAHLQGLPAVLGEVYRRGHRKRPEQVRAMLDQELQAAGLTLSEAARARFAHDLATQPPLLLGLLFGRFYHRKRRADGHQWPAGNPEVEALSDRLLKLRGVSQVTVSESDSDRLIFVRLDPWSDRVAKRVRRKAAPHKVRFID